jgi:hypothetical protein
MLRGQPSLNRITTAELEERWDLSAAKSRSASAPWRRTGHPKFDLASSLDGGISYAEQLDGYWAATTNNRQGWSDLVCIQAISGQRCHLAPLNVNRT